MTFISADCIGALWIWELGNPNPNKIPPPIHHGFPVENDLFATVKVMRSWGIGCCPHGEF